LRKAFSIGRHLEEKKRPSRWLECVFDSFTAPVPTGLRETSPTSRMLLFEGGDYSVHIKKGKGEKYSRCNIHGQVLRRSLRPSPVSSAGVTVERGSKVLSEGRTDDLGEFSFRDLPQGRFKVKILLEEGALSIVIPRGEAR
jgi:hypothetical protein